MKAQETKQTRRYFIQKSTLYLAGLPLASCAYAVPQAGEEKTKRLVRAGMITDIHYANKPPRGTRYYRDSLPKLQDAVRHFNQIKPDFVVQLGDFIDAGKTLNQEIDNLKKIESLYAKLSMPRHYVYGNHCLHSLTKKEFKQHTGKSKNYESYDHNGVHFVILDACHRSKDGVDYQRKNFTWKDSFIPPKQMQWLANDLQKTKWPTVIFTHQRIDGLTQNNHRVTNASQVQKIIQKSKRVLAVFQGHSHQNDYSQIQGIHYVTLKACVENQGLQNKSYATLNIFSDGSIAVQGFGKQTPYQL